MFVWVKDFCLGMLQTPSSEMSQGIFVLGALVVYVFVPLARRRGMEFTEAPLLALEYLLVETWGRCGILPSSPITYRF